MFRGILNKIKRCYLHTAINAKTTAITIATTEAKDIKVKLSENV